ncbi:MAG: dihydrofolate reductase, partial [Eubacteriales bacterium]
KGKLLLSIPEDMKYFKEMTMNKTIVMGRLTFESLSDGKPLTNRRNIVLSTKDNYTHSGIEVYHTLKDFLKNHQIPPLMIFLLLAEKPFIINYYLTAPMYI